MHREVVTQQADHGDRVDDTARQKTGRAAGERGVVQVRTVGELRDNQHEEQPDYSKVDD